MGVNRLRQGGTELGGDRDAAEGLPIDADVDGLAGRMKLRTVGAAADCVGDGQGRVADGDALDVDAEGRREGERLPVVGLRVDERQTPGALGEDLLEADAASRESGGVRVVEPLEEAREEHDSRGVDFLEENGSRLGEEGHAGGRIFTAAIRGKEELAVHNPAVAREPVDPLREPEDRFVDAVGGAIEFWGFRRVLGHIWGWLYLQGAPRTAAEICSRLTLSKALVSTSLTELERWGCVRRFRRPGSRREMFEAEQDVWAMVSRVFRERELLMVKQIADTLDGVGEDLKGLSKKAGVTRDEAKARLERVQRMGDLAQFAAIAIQGFLDQGLADVRPLKGDDR